MKTRICAFLAALLLMVSLGGCIAVDIGYGGATGTVQAEGAPVTREIPVGSFSQVQLLCDVDLVYKAGDCGATITTYENFIEHMTFEVQNDILIVDAQKQLTYEFDRPVLTVTAPTLSALYVIGTAEVFDSDPIQGDSFYLEIMGSADMELNLELSSLNVVTSGSAELDLSGTADDITVTCSGAAEIDALALAAKQVNARISGSADLTVSCSELLEVNISGSGTVAYRGNPEVIKRISGAGDLRQVT